MGTETERRQDATQAIAPQPVEEPAPATAPAKQAANAQAADAATQRMASLTQHDPNVAPQKITTATAQSRVTLARPAELKVAAVVADHPVFSGSVAFTVGELLAGIHGDVGITADEAKQITGVELAGGPDKGAQYDVQVSGDRIVLGASGLSAPQSLNASAFKLSFASGHSLLVTFDIAQFHTDVTEWRRGALLNDIRGTQAEIDQFSKIQAEEQAIADHPPPADVSHEQADVAAVTASLAATNAQIAGRVADLEGRWKALDPTLEGMIATQFESEGGAAAEIAQAGRAVQAAAAAYGGAKSMLAQSQANAATIHDAFKDGPLPPSLAGIDAEVAAAEQKAAALAAELQAKQAALVKLVDANRALLERLVSSNEESIARGKTPPPGAQQALADLLVLRVLAEDKLDRLNQAIADKLAEPAKEAQASKAHAAAYGDTVKQAQARLAALEQELAALKGPIWVTLGPDGGALPEPAKAPAKP